MLGLLGPAFRVCSKSFRNALSCAPIAAQESKHKSMAVLAACAAAIAIADQTSCDYSHLSPVKDVKLQLFKQWLEDHGADVSAVDFKCQDESQGVGVYANDEVKRRYRGGFWRRALGWAIPYRQTTILSIPTCLLINERTITRDERIGAVLLRHLDAGNIDGRQAVMLWLVMHRAMGAASPWQPYLSVLPTSFDTPLHYDESELAQVAGTSLYDGTVAAKAKIAKSWVQLQPVVQELQATAGLQQAVLQRADYQWAFSLFWSRCYMLGAGADAAADGGGASGVETLVPGLDMANHSSRARCYWRLVMQPRNSMASEADTAGSNAGTSAGASAASAGVAASPRVNAVELQAWNWGGPRPGDEVCIQYQETSNDAFMFAHGFANENNPNDTVLVRVPLPPVEEWDDVMRARILLLQEQGLAPHFVLKRPERSRKRKPDAPLKLPQEARSVIEIMLMSPTDLLKRFETPEDGAAQSESAQQTPLGADLAVYTTLCHLLEAKLHDMEGKDGTGTLEEDIKLIEAGQEGLSAKQWNCLLYRSSQKRIVREYLACAQSNLLTVIKDMQLAANADFENPVRKKV